MALKKDDIAKLKLMGIEISKDGVSILGIDIKKLNDAIAATEEVEFNAEYVAPKGLNIVKDEDIEQLKTAAKGEAKTATEKALPEILAKAYKEKYGIKLDTKDLDEVIKAVVAAESDKAIKASGLTVEEQVKAVTTAKDKDIETIRENMEKLQSERDNLEAESKKWRGEAESMKENEMFSRLLGDKVNPLLKPAEYRARMKEEEGIDFKMVNGKFVPVDNEGNVLKDKFLKEIPAEKKIAEILEKRKEWVRSTEGGSGSGKGEGGFGTGGSGNGGSGGGGSDKKYANMSELKAAAAQNKWNQKQLKQEYQKQVSENPEFNVNA